MRQAAEIHQLPDVAASIAHLASTAALAVDGVADTAAGQLGRQLTLNRDRRADGVVAATGADGLVDVTLYLVADLVPLPALADRVRAAVRATVRAAGLAAALGEITVAIDAVRAPGETEC